MSPVSFHLICCCAHQARWPTGFQGLFCLNLSCCRTAKLRSCTLLTWLYFPLGIRTPVLCSHSKCFIHWPIFPGIFFWWLLFNTHFSHIGLSVCILIISCSKWLSNSGSSFPFTNMWWFPGGFLWLPHFEGEEDGGKLVGTWGLKLVAFLIFAFL